MGRSHPEREDWGKCNIVDCGNFVAIRKYGVCNRHYRSLKFEQGRSMGLDLERAASDFWTKVDIDHPAACWYWRGTPHKQGHGTYWQNNVSYHAHVVSFQLVHGEVPVGLVVDHKCRNRLCVNPGHLHAVTRKQNTENIGLRKDNPSGYRGVTPRGNGKWRARVGQNGNVIHVGDFDSPELAHEAVLSARLRLHTNNLEDRGIRFG